MDLEEELLEEPDLVEVDVEGGGGVERGDRWRKTWIDRGVKGWSEEKGDEGNKGIRTGTSE